MLTECDETGVTEIYNSWNTASVDNSPSCSPFFTISQPYYISYIDTYHWNYGRGTSAGGTVSLKSGNGLTYGPWNVETTPGQGGVPNANWIAHPNEVIPAGGYTIVDSDPSTWSQNSGSRCGFSKVEGYPASNTPIPTRSVSSSSSAQGYIIQPGPNQEQIFGQYSLAGVLNSPSNPTIFTIDQSRTIATLVTYHYNNGQGQTPGTIGLRDQNGNTWGPWQATLLRNVYWVVDLNPYVNLPAGTYTIMDSDPSTWSYNSETGNCGIAEVIALKVGSSNQNGSVNGSSDQNGPMHNWTLGTGDVQVTLSWNANADLDLHVVDPSGDEVYYSNPSVSSGGQLDLDNKCSNFVMGKPENIYWPTGKAPSGTYKVSVVYYGDCSGSGTPTGPVDWTVTTKVNGKVNTFRGTLNNVGDTEDVTTFQLGNVSTSSEGNTGIRGDVLEVNTFEPIPNAIVTATDLTSGATQAVNVNSDGKYSIHLLPGHYKVEAKATGYLDESGVFGDDVKVLNPHEEPYCTDCFTTFNFRMVPGPIGTPGLRGGGLKGKWKMHGHQEGFNDWEADLVLNSDDTLTWTETVGANVGATRTGTWQFDGTTFTMNYISPNGGQTNWKSQSVTNNTMEAGTYTVENAPGGTWSAQRVQNGL